MLALAAGAGVPLHADAQVATPATAVGVHPALEREAVAVRRADHGSLLGVARSGVRLVAVGERGLVRLSDDEGRSWRQARQVPVSVTLTAVQFIDARVGWAVGHQGVVLRSDDGGEHWVRCLDGKAAAERVLSEAKARHAAAGSEVGAQRALAEAERLVAEGSDKPLLALHFHSEQEGLVIGAFGLMLETRDGGRNWRSVSSRLDNPKGAHLYALHRQGDSLLVAGEQGLLWHSSDAGRRFQRIPTPYNGSWFTVAHDGDGWLVAGLRGNALRSRDEGRSWQSLATPMPVSITAQWQESDGGWGLLNQAGVLLRSEPGADRLKVLSTSSAQQPGAALRLADGALLIAGWNGLTRMDRPTGQPGVKR